MAKSTRELSLDEGGESELSEVRTRADVEHPGRRTSEPNVAWLPSARPAAAASWAPPSDERALRLAHKGVLARELLKHLSESDPRARLLRVALLRSDEVLIDALLRRSDSLPPGVRER